MSALLHFRRANCVKSYPILKNGMSASLHFWRANCYIWNYRSIPVATTIWRTTPSYLYIIVIFRTWKTKNSKLRFSNNKVDIRYECLVILSSPIQYTLSSHLFRHQLVGPVLLKSSFIADSQLGRIRCQSYKNYTYFIIAAWSNFVIIKTML